MKHNIHKFTIKFHVSEDVPAKELITDHIQMVTMSMAHECAEIANLQVTYMKPNNFTAVLDLVAKDYGVPQVGIFLIAEWIRQIYRESTEEFGFLVDTMIIHPRNDTIGAIVKWDPINDRLIIKEIKS